MSKLIRALGLPSASKRKSDMAAAIEQYLYTARSRNDAGIVYAVRSLVLLSENEQQLPEFTNVLAQVRMQIRNSMNPQSVQQREVTFKKSAFYNIVTKVSAEGKNPVIASKEPEDLNISRISFTLTDQEREILSRPDHRLCAFASPLDEFRGEKYIEFPIPCKLIVNNIEVPGNYKGIKGKKSSVVPWDITSAVKREEKNYVTIKYAYTTCDFIFYFYLIQTIKVESLVNEVLAQPHIPMEKTLSMIKESEQDDISASKETLSLLCPCSYVRMEYPVRSVKCDHIQCFDIYSYLLLQEKGPTWLCPVCYHKIKLSHLEVDEYFDSIIKNTGPEYDYVEIKNDGTWTPQEYLNDTLAPSKILPSNGSIKIVNPNVTVKQEDGDVIKLDMGKLVLVDSDANGNTIFEVQELKRRSAKTSTPVVQQISAVLAPEKPPLQNTITPPVANKPLAPPPPTDVIEILSEEEEPIDAADMSNQMLNIQNTSVLPSGATNGNVQLESMRTATSNHTHSLVNIDKSHFSRNGIQGSNTTAQPNIATTVNANSSNNTSNAQPTILNERPHIFRGTTNDLSNQQNSALSSQSQPHTLQQQQFLTNPRSAASDQMQSMRVRQRVQHAQLEAQQRLQAQQEEHAHLIEQARQAQAVEQARQARQAQALEQARQAQAVEQARQAQAVEQARQARQARQAQALEQARRAQTVEQARKAQEAHKLQESQRQQKLAEAEGRRTDVNRENSSAFSPSIDSTDISYESSVERCRSIAKELKFMSKTTSLLNSMYLNYVWSDLKARELVVNEAHSLRSNGIPLPGIMNDQYSDSSKSIVSFMSFSFDICCSILLQIVSREQNFSRTLDNYLRMQIPKLHPQHGEIYNEFCMKLYFNDASYRIYYRLAARLRELLGVKDSLNYMEKKLKLVNVFSDVRSDLSAFFRNPSTSVFYKLSIIRLAKSLSHCGFPFNVVQETDIGEIYRLKVLEQRLSGFDSRNFNINNMATTSSQAETQNFTPNSAGANGSYSTNNSAEGSFTQVPDNTSQTTGNHSEQLQSYESTTSYGFPQVPEGSANTASHNMDRMPQHDHISSNQLPSPDGATTTDYSHLPKSTQSRDNTTVVDAGRKDGDSPHASSRAPEVLQPQDNIASAQDLRITANNSASEQTPLSDNINFPQSTSTNNNISANLDKRIPNSSTPPIQDARLTKGTTESPGSGSSSSPLEALPQHDTTIKPSDRVSVITTDIPKHASTLVENRIEVNETAKDALVESSLPPSSVTSKDTSNEASVEKPVEKLVGKSVGQPSEKPIEIPMAKTTHEPAEKSTDMLVERQERTEAVANVSAGNLVEKITDKLDGITVDKLAENEPKAPIGNSQRSSNGKSNEQSIELLIQKFTQKPGQGNVANTTNKPAADTGDASETAKADDDGQLPQSRRSSVQETENLPSEDQIEQADNSTPTHEISERKDNDTDVSPSSRVLPTPSLLNNVNKGILKPISISANAIKTKSKNGTAENQNVVVNTLKALENNRRSLNIKYAGLAGIREKSLREKSQMSDKVIQLIEKAKADQLARKQKMQEILAKPSVQEESQPDEVDKGDTGKTEERQKVAEAGKDETDGRQKTSEGDKEESEGEQKVPEVEREAPARTPRVSENDKEKLVEKQEAPEVAKEQSARRPEVSEGEKEESADKQKAAEAGKEAGKQLEKTKDKIPPPAASREGANGTEPEKNGSTGGGLLGFSLPSSVKSFLKAPAKKASAESERADLKTAENERRKSRERREDKSRPAVSDEIKGTRQRESGAGAKSPNSTHYEGDLPPLPPPPLPPVYRLAHASDERKEAAEGRKSPVGGSVPALHRAGKHGRVHGHADRERGLASGMKKRKTVKIPQQTQAQPKPQLPTAPAALQQMPGPPPPPPPPPAPQQHHGSNDLLRMFKQSANDVSGVFRERKGGGAAGSANASSSSSKKKHGSMGRGGAGRNVSLVEPEIIDLTSDD